MAGSTAPSTWILPWGEIPSWPSTSIPGISTRTSATFALFPRTDRSIVVFPRRQWQASTSLPWHPSTRYDHLKEFCRPLFKSSFQSALVSFSAAGRVEVFLRPAVAESPISLCESHVQIAAQDLQRPAEGPAHGQTSHHSARIR